MARRDTGPDPKEAALAETRCLNPHPEQVRDPEFLASDFFDARDVVQVKYEMVRKVKAGGAPVTEAAAAFGYSRPSYYEAAAALERSGLEGLVPARPGPRGGHKLTEEILAWAEEQLAADPAHRRPVAPPGQHPRREQHVRDPARAAPRPPRRGQAGRGLVRGLAILAAGAPQPGREVVPAAARYHTPFALCPASAGCHTPGSAVIRPDVTASTRA